MANGEDPDENVKEHRISLGSKQLMLNIKAIFMDINIIMRKSVQNFEKVKRTVRLHPPMQPYMDIIYTVSKFHWKKINAQIALV